MAALAPWRICRAVVRYVFARFEWPIQCYHRPGHLLAYARPSTGAKEDFAVEQTLFEDSGRVDNRYDVSCRCHDRDSKGLTVGVYGLSLTFGNAILISRSRARTPVGDGADYRFSNESRIAGGGR